MDERLLILFEGKVIREKRERGGFGETVATKS